MTWTGSQTDVVRYAKPKRWMDGHESMSTSAAMPASVSGTSNASAVTPAANARSAVRVTELLEDRGAAGGDRLERGFGGGHDVRGKGGVPEVLGERLAAVHAVPGEAQDREGLALVGDVLGNEEEREGRDGPGIRVGRVRDRDLGLLALEVAPVGRSEAIGGLRGRVEARLDVLPARVLHDAVADLVLDRVDELDVADRARGALHRAGDAGVAVAAHAARPVDGGGRADLRLPVGTHLREIVGEHAGGTGAVRAMDGRDPHVRERHA